MPNTSSDLQRRSVPIPSGTVALIGGRFDPFHNGHLHIAIQLLNLAPVSKVVFLPNDRHGFKDSAVLSFDQRLSLIRQSIEEYPHLECWDSDSRDYGSGWTDELMFRLRSAHPDLYFCFVIGTDNLPALDRWHNFPWLAANVHFIVVPRDNVTVEHPILEQITYSMVEMPLVPISSSEIRARVKGGESITGLVPAKIEADILHLYSIK